MSYRSYFTKWPVAKALAGFAATGASMLVLIRNLQTPPILHLMPGDGQANPAFRKVGPSFLRLRLSSSEHVSPTTKRLRFELPSSGATSGLGLCCMYAASVSVSQTTDLAIKQLPCSRPRGRKEASFQS